MNGPWAIIDFHTELVASIKTTGMAYIQYGYVILVLLLVRRSVLLLNTLVRHCWEAVISLNTSSFPFDKYLPRENCYLQ